MYKLIGKNGEVVTVKTVMDRKEYIDSGYYKEHKEVQVSESLDKETKPEKKPMDSESAMELAKALVSGEKEEKQLEDMSLDELKAEYKEVFGKAAVGAVKEETLIRKIREERTSQ